MSFKLGANSLNNRAGVDPRLIEISDRAIQISIIDFGHPQYSGLRTVEDQAKLFTAGKSMADGRTNKSFHQTGRALDVFAINPETGKASWEKEHLAIVAVAFMQSANELGYKLEWGGLWTGFQDMPHFQLGE
jgi:peptidoglycan L-alanyl-D-glutamate endopeptidase CwlK